MFGESIAVWLLNEWMKMGEPSNFQLVELGPGSGTLTCDILRTFAKLRPETMTGLSVHLVEISQKLRELQREALGCQECGADADTDTRDVQTRYGNKITWHEHISDVPQGFSFYIGM